MSESPRAASRDHLFPVAASSYLGSRNVLLPGLSLVLSLAFACLAGCSNGNSKPEETTNKKPSIFDEMLAETEATPETETAAHDAGFRFATINDSGVDFVHQSGNSDIRPFPAANGSGVGVVDFDLDGWPDLYFANGTTFPVDLEQIEFQDHCYRNLGNFQFQPVAQQAHVHWQGYSAGVAVGDFNSDGFSDLYVNCYGSNRLYQNQGDGTFVDVTQSAQADDLHWGSSAVFCDYNQDGLQDLYIGNYAIWDLETNKFCPNPTDRSERIFCSPLSVDPAPDRLLENLGDGTFKDVTSAAGILPRKARTQGVMAGDFDLKGGTDLYLGNDMHPNSLFLMRQDGRYQDLTDQSGMGYDAMGKSQAGMGLAAADVDQNGSLEVFVTNYSGENNSFYQLVREDGYSETSSSRGLSTDSVQWVGWGTVFVDIDMDQWPDLIVSNGHTDHNKSNEPYYQPCLAWQNQQGRFVLTGSQNGPYFAEPHLGRGLAIADLDNDGDWDLVFAHLGVTPAILRNDTPQKMSTLTLELEGRTANRDATAARVQLKQNGKTLHFHLLGGGSYLSTHQNKLILPVDSTTPLELTFFWPDGTESRETVQQLPATGRIHVRQPQTAAGL